MRRVRQARGLPGEGGLSAAHVNATPVRNSDLVRRLLVRAGDNDANKHRCKDQSEHPVCEYSNAPMATHEDKVKKTRDYRIRSGHTETQQPEPSIEGQCLTPPVRRFSPIPLGKETDMPKAPGDTKSQHE